MANNESKFSRSSFHREGAKGVPNISPSKPTKGKQDPGFLKGLVETGRVDWEKAPKAIRTRYTGIYLVLVSIPIITLSSYELYRRLEGKSTKKVQEGELVDGKEVRKFDEIEKWQVEKNSLMYRLFGKDFFLDGFTSKTINKNSTDEQDKGT
ncbi:Piso0_000313 [Millerozyma farinosa CBS 7064]|uniref:Piso0_000313 protein n=1 Tax=Pichia sorbitophila (strain ATCC MYA-4447 / BCRC 22081 / CBS 7064 / NBRC 10061 / NRRL Y-12695) TaxID=559304 RepID=G8YTN1_PICSO|nr:Piso0_000313 [Millerozyma farinosa CBS 7064]